MKMVNYQNIILTVTLNHDITCIIMIKHQLIDNRNISYKMGFFLAKYIFPIGNGYQHVVKLVENKRIHDGNIKVRFSYNPILDTIEYVLQYPYIHEHRLEYHKVIEHIYS